MAENQRVTFQTWLDKRPADTSADWLPWANEVLPAFMQQVTRESFQVDSKTTLHYCLYEQPTPAPWVVISSGRVETYEKYAELMLELASWGYSVAALDHKGQGYSSRKAPQIGHIEHFSEFIEGFSQFVELIRPKFGDQPAFLLGHSMGGAIATLYMLEQVMQSTETTPLFEALVLCAPMFGIQTGNKPASIASGFVGLGTCWHRIFSKGQPRYYLGMKDFEPVPFLENELTHSFSRYEWMQQLYLKQPELQVGGPSWQWLHAAFGAISKIQNNIQHLDVPLLLLQAEEDEIVSLEGQNNAFAKLQQASSTHSKKLLPVPNAKHEILMETDKIRAPALAKIQGFLAEYAR